ncbi:MAG: SDR family oxidoreductase, partial [Candidatus Diapherotrites archaeon]|nr:SDR family oxidoreductase [Candidatus Diapherotrites archaeon]
MNRLLIIGANGFLGKKICKIVSQNGFETIETDLFADKRQIKLDVTKKNSVMDAIKKYKPHAVIHCAAVTDVDWCEENMEETFEVNVEGTKNVSTTCSQFDSKMVFISTDYVFDGKKKSKYSEVDATNPLSVYAKSKLEGEKIVSKENPANLILRTSAIYGFNGKKDKLTFPAFIIGKLKQKKEVTCFTDQSCNPTLTDDFAFALKSLLEKNCSGTFHVAGSECL